jgi:hypothetical protein
MRRCRHRLSLILVVSYLFAAAGLEAGESVSTQSSDYLGIVKAYADAMIEHGSGPQDYEDRLVRQYPRGKEW